MTGSPSVVVLGDALIDEMRDEHGTVDAPGGSALNVAVGLSLLGVPATLVGMVGDDPDGETLVRHAAEHGVALLRSPAPLGTGRAVSDRTAGEPVYAFNAACRARAIAFSPEVLRAMNAADLVVVSGYPFDDTAQVDALLRAVRSPSERLLIDPNPRSGMLIDRARYVANLDRAAAGSLLVKIGEEDAALLNRQPLDVVAHHLVSLGARYVLATAGPRGAAVHWSGGVVERPIASSTGAIVDTMGAGDAVFAAIAARLAGTANPDAAGWERALDHAMAIAAATIRQPGGLLRLA